MLRWWFFCFLAVLSGGHTEKIFTDGYQFNIQVINRWSKPVNEFKSKVKLKDNKAKIQVRAAGYLPTSQEVLLLEGQTQYNVKVKVREAWTDIDVRNTQGGYVSTVHRELGSEVASDQYRVEISILEFNYSHFTSWDVDLEIDNWPILGAEIKVTGSAFQRQLVITLPRKYFRNSFNPRLQVEIPRDGFSLKEARISKLRKLNFQLHNNLQDEQSTLQQIKVMERLIRP